MDYVITILFYIKSYHQIYWYVEFPVHENIAIKLHIFRDSSNFFLQWGKFHFRGAFLFFSSVFKQVTCSILEYFAWMSHKNPCKSSVCMIILHQKNFEPTDSSIDDSLTCLLAWIQVLTCDASNWHNGFKYF